MAAEHFLSAELDTANNYFLYHTLQGAMCGVSVRCHHHLLVRQPHFEQVHVVTPVRHLAHVIRDRLEPFHLVRGQTAREIPELSKLPDPLVRDPL